MKIKKDDLVLEIGSGNSPRWRSDIIADRLVHDDSQRAGKFSIVIDRPFVVADGYHLPFKNKVFDYVICSHVLEHMENPEAFVKEIMRVGKAGYIEVPDILGERLFGWDFHLWYCECKNKTITMIRKDEGEQFDGFFHRLIANQIWFRRFFELYEKKFYIQYEWTKKINLKIIRQPKNLNILEKKADKQVYSLLKTIDWSWREDSLFYLTWLVKRIVRKGKKEWRRFNWRMKSKFQKEEVINGLLPYFQCPTCKGEKLEIQNGIRNVCKNCKTKYPIDGVIPIMLTRQEIKKGY